jgi:hypothetical protein
LFLHLSYTQELFFLLNAFFFTFWKITKDVTESTSCDFYASRVGVELWLAYLYTRVKRGIRADCVLIAIEEKNKKKGGGQRAGKKRKRAKNIYY